MKAVEWTQIGILAGLTVTGFGYLTRLIHREIDGVTVRLDRLDDRLERLDERYIRHLEQHAGS